MKIMRVFCSKQEGDFVCPVPYLRHMWIYALKKRSTGWRSTAKSSIFGPIALAVSSKLLRVELNFKHSLQNGNI